MPNNIVTFQNTNKKEMQCLIIIKQMLNCCKILLWEGGIQKFNCQISRKGETGTFIPNGLEFFIGGSDCRIFFFS
jgi:hypothetical protein